MQKENTRNTFQLVKKTSGENPSSYGNEWKGGGGFYFGFLRGTSSNKDQCWANLYSFTPLVSLCNKQITFFLFKLHLETTNFKQQICLCDRCLDFISLFCWNKILLSSGERSCFRLNMTTKLMKHLVSEYCIM